MHNEEETWETKKLVGKRKKISRKVFYNMAKKADKLFLESEKALGHEKEGVDDNRSTNHEGGGEDPPPSPSSRYSSHHSHCDSKHSSKKPFFKLDVKFDLLMYNGECSVEKLNNWIR